MTHRSSSLLAFIAMILVILLIMFLTSCSDKATRHLRKAQRHLTLAEKYGAKVKADTLWKTLETPVPEVRTDTVFQSQDGDTVVITRDRLRIRYIDRPGDTVEIAGECKADTIIQKVPVRVTKEIKSGYTKWDMVIIVLATLPAGWLLFSFVVVPLVRRRR